MPAPCHSVDTFVHLGPEGSAVALPVDDSFWERLAAGGFDHLGPGRLVSSYAFSADWTNWEMHPAGEEVVVLLSGAMEFMLEAANGGHSTVALSEPGQFVLVPRGAWHTANIAGAATALFITPGEGTEHRPRS